MGYTLALKEVFLYDVYTTVFTLGDPDSRLNRTTSPPVQSEWPKYYCIYRLLKCYCHAETELYKTEYQFGKLYHASKHHVYKSMVNRKFISVLNIDPVWKWEVKFSPGRFTP